MLASGQYMNLEVVALDLQVHLLQFWWGCAYRLLKNRD